MIYDEGYMVRIERPGEHGWQTSHYLTVANGDSAPQIRFFTQKRWAKIVARRQLPAGCRAILCYGSLVGIRDNDKQALGEGWVVSHKWNADMEWQPKKVYIGYGNRGFVKLYVNSTKDEPNKVKCERAKVVHNGGEEQLIQ